MAKFRLGLEPDGIRFKTTEEMARRIERGLLSVYKKPATVLPSGSDGMYELDLTGFSEEEVSGAKDMLGDYIKG